RRAKRPFLHTSGEERTSTLGHKHITILSLELPEVRQLQHSNTSTLQHFNTSTLQPFNTPKTTPHSLPPASISNPVQNNSQAFSIHPCATHDRRCLRSTGYRSCCWRRRRRHSRRAGR